MVLLKAMHLRGEDMARPEDMVSMRIWFGKDKVITTREADVTRSSKSLVVWFRGGPTRLPHFADRIVEHLDEVEGRSKCLKTTQTGSASRGAAKNRIRLPKHGGYRNRISGFLRHLGPQRPVLETLSTLQHPLLDDRTRSRLEDDC